MCESHYWKATFCGGRYLIAPSEAEMHMKYEAVGLKRFVECWYYNIHQPELLYTPQLHTALNFVHEECTKVNNGKFLFSGGRHKLDYHMPCWNVNQIILQLSNVDWCMIVHWILWPTICTLGESEIEGGWPVLERKFNTNILKTNSPKHTRKD